MKYPARGLSKRVVPAQFPRRTKTPMQQIPMSPQYFTVRVLDVPAEWNVKNGSERCVGLEHWHGSKKAHTNGFDFIFTPAALTKHKYKLILELAPNGRGESYYIPLTLLNGACK